MIEFNLNVAINSNDDKKKTNAADPHFTMIYKTNHLLHPYATNFTNMEIALRMNHHYLNARCAFSIDERIGFVLDDRNT